MSYTHAFVVVIKGTEKRYTRTLMTWLSEIVKLFGSDFWEHVIIVVSHWSYDTHNVQMRFAHVPPHTEDLWMNETRAMLSEHFTIRNKIPIVFIDSHYDKSNTQEVVRFNRGASHLYKYIMEIENRFMFRNVTVVKSDILLLQEKVKNLTKDNNELLLQKTNLELEQTKLNISFQSKEHYDELNNNHDVHYEVIVVFVIAAIIICLFLVFLLIRYAFLSKTDSDIDMSKHSDTDEC